MAGSSNGDRSVTLLDIEALDCPICFEALTAQIFQCDNGHIACSSCCNKLRNKCPSCTRPNGHIRCRALERVIKGVIFPCPNVKLGCTKSFSYGKYLSTHAKECVFSLCSCPEPDCEYTCSYKDLFSHFGIHRDEYRYVYGFDFGESFGIWFDITVYTSNVMKEHNADLLFVTQWFPEAHGVYVTVSCIAPCAKEVGEFSCCISTLGKDSMRIELSEVKRIHKLSAETPKENFMLIPSFVFHGCRWLMLSISISKVKPNERRW